jgi:tRNA(fMet)-specific endonuclease VapC
VFCLDTNIVIAIINRRKPELRTRLAAEVERQTTVLVPTCVVYELLYGAAKSEWPDRNRQRITEFLASDVVIEPFNTSDAAEAGAIRADLERRGLPIGPIDILIAAQARKRSAVLVTDNRREFERIPGLMVTGWD